MAKKRKGNAKVVWAIAVVGVITGVAAFSAGYSNPASQVAVGAAADMQCAGDYDPTCQYPQTNPRTGKKCLIGKPCQDVTSGHVTSGTCQALNKCRGEQTGGMMPMLPMLPMPMPKMGGAPPMQEPCPATGTESTTTTASMGFGISPCPQQTSSLSNYIFGSTENASTTTSESSGWGDLLGSLFGFMDDEEANTSTENEQQAGGEDTTESGFFAGLRRGVQTIVRLTSATPSAGAVPASDTAASPWRSGYTPSESTFVSTGVSAEATDASVIATIQTTLAQLAGTLRNFLSSLTK